MSWLALVVGASVLPWLSGGALLIVAGLVALGAAVVGWRLGLPRVLGVAALTVLVVGAVAVLTRGDLRDRTLPECQGLMSGVGENHGPCLQTASEQALSGTGPALVVLLLGLPAGLLRLVWDEGERNARAEGDGST